MFRTIVFLACAAAAFSQTPADLFNRPPEDVDRALRARISAFYQAHVDGKPRLAEPLVAEDTKDAFYNAEKPKYLSFEIRKIDYSDDFTRAKVTILLEQYVPVPGFLDKPLKVPTPSTWKLVDGQWYWYIDQNLLHHRDSPFGTMTAGPTPNGAATSPLPTTIPTLKDMNFIFSQVKADKGTVSLKPGEPEQVIISNGATGAVSLTVMGVPPGVDAKLDHADVGAGGKAILTLRASARTRPGVISLRVEQTNQVIPIQVDFQ
jgi:hypothetical protein